MSEATSAPRKVSLWSMIHETMMYSETINVLPASSPTTKVISAISRRRKYAASSARIESAENRSNTRDSARFALTTLTAAKTSWAREVRSLLAIRLARTRRRILGVETMLSQATGKTTTTTMSVNHGSNMATTKSPKSRPNAALMGV